MLEISIVLFGAARVLVELGRAHNPAYARFMEGRQASLAFAEAVRTGKLGSGASAAARHTQR